MHYEASGNVHRTGHTVVPHRHTVEVGAFGKRYEAVLGHVLSGYIYRWISKAEREFKRSVVQYLVIFIAIGHDKRVAKHQGRRTATQTRTYVVAVETLTVVEVERCGTVNKVYSLLIAYATEERLSMFDCHVTA